MMKTVALTIVAALIPSVAFAQCSEGEAVINFMQKMHLTVNMLIYKTHDVTNRLPVYVFDFGNKAASPEQRYAIAWVDAKTCTTDAIFRDQEGMLLAMEQQVYDIDQ